MNYEGQAEVTWVSIFMLGEKTELVSIVTEILWEQRESEIYGGVGNTGGVVSRHPRVTIFNVPSGIGSATHFRVTLNEDTYQGETAVYSAANNREGELCIQYTTSMRKIK